MGQVAYESSQFRAGSRAPAVGKVEYKRGVDAGVINQGLLYLSWLMDHRAEFEHLVAQAFLTLRRLDTKVRTPA
ncbi:hypothetical protein [Streptomyces sp. NPDC013187]|uniref:hypothetical protein n=1 Tax=Streptomyces sp. NPDC013187 TaxID=3364865 RepID=UPI0036A84BD5